MNAMQATDAAMGGFNSAFQIVADAMEDFRQNEAKLKSLQYERQLKAWTDYALVLQQNNLNLRYSGEKLNVSARKLAEGYEVLAKENEELRIQLEKEKRTSADYLASLSTKLLKVNEFIKRLSGKSFAYEKMSERLYAELQAVTTNGQSIFGNPEAFKKQLEDDWEHFMETNEVRRFNYVELVNPKQAIRVPTPTL